MLRTKLSHVNEGGVAAGMDTLLDIQYSTKNSLEFCITAKLLVKEIQNKNFQDLGPWTLCTWWTPRAAALEYVQQRIICDLWRENFHAGSEDGIVCVCCYSCYDLIVILDGPTNTRKKMILHSMCNKFKETCLDFRMEQLYCDYIPALKHHISFVWTTRKLTWTPRDLHGLIL